MIFKNLYFQVIVRVVLIVVNTFLLVYTYHFFSNPITSINLMALLLIQTFLLIHYLNKLNRDVARFISTIKNNDSSFIKPPVVNSSNKYLWEQIEEINKSIRSIKNIHEKQNIYFKMVTEHIPTGLISINQNSQIDIFNKAAKKLLAPNNDQDQTNRIDENIFETLRNLPLNLPYLLKHRVNNNVTVLSLNATELREENTTLKLISVQDIANELDNKEIESWHKLIQVINHEIRNSIAPISSTIDKLIDLLAQQSNIKTDEQNSHKKAIAKTLNGLKIIQDQSKGLHEFVDKYQYFSNIPKLKIKVLDAKDLVKTCISIFGQQFKTSELKIEFTQASGSFQINADQVLLERTFINLFTNAMYANANQVIISIKKDETGKIEIAVADDGDGIPEEFLDKIFIPFFTTRDDGSGIGLSFSKQIMQLHNGSISVNSKLKVGTTFILKF